MDDQMKVAAYHAPYWRQRNRSLWHAAASRAEFSRHSRFATTEYRVTRTEDEIADEINRIQYLGALPKT
jgi:hypothetical protein